MYYKRVDCPEWKGAGTVIGQDGAVVCVRHGGTWVKVMVKVRSYLRLRTEMELMNNKPLLTIQKVPQT